MFLKAVYLLGASPAEMTGIIAADSKKTGRIYGPIGTDVAETAINLDQPEFNFNDVINLLDQLRSQEFRAEQFVNSVSKIPIALFTIKTAKQGKNWRPKDSREYLKRTVALPLIEKYELWTKQLFDYFRKKGSDYVFLFDRAKPMEYIKRNNVFKGKTYTITAYYLDGNKSFQVSEHPRKLAMYGLRYLRNDELRSKYKFDWADIETYTGMKIRHQSRVHVVAKESLTSADWHVYINKLCTVHKTIAV